MNTNPRRQHGFTLIEGMVTVAIVAVLVGVAVPSLRDTQERRRIDGVAAQLETDLMLARSEAVMRNESVHVAVVRDDAGSCYVIHSGDSGDCTCSGNGAPVCQPGAQLLRSAQMASGESVQLKANVHSMLFDAVKGTVTPAATIQVQGSVGTVRTIVNIMGRVRHCSSGSTALSGYPLC